MGLFDGLFGGGSGLFGGGGLFGGSCTFGGSGWSSGGSSFVGPNPIEKQTTDIATQLVKDYIKKNDDGVRGDIVRLSDDTKEEFTELMTVGFTEMVIKGNKNYKTSFEIRDEADEIIYKQMERYKAKCSEINESIEKLDLHIRKLHKTKIDLSNELNLIVNNASTINQKVKYNSWAEPGYQNAKDGISILFRMCWIG